MCRCVDVCIYSRVHLRVCFCESITLYLYVKILNILVDVDSHGPTFKVESVKDQHTRHEGRSSPLL